MTRNHDWRSATSVLTAGWSEESNPIDPRGERQLNDCLTKSVFTARQRNYGKIVFSVVCVCHSVHSGGPSPPLPVYAPHCTEFPPCRVPPTPGHVQTCSTWTSLRRHLLECFLVSSSHFFGIRRIYCICYKNTCAKLRISCCKFAKSIFFLCSRNKAIGV